MKRSSQLAISGMFSAWLREAISVSIEPRSTRKTSSAGISSTNSSVYSSAAPRFRMNEPPVPLIFCSPSWMAATPAEADHREAITDTETASVPARRSTLAITVSNRVCTCGTSGSSSCTTDLRFSRSTVGTRFTSPITSVSSGIMAMRI